MPRRIRTRGWLRRRVKMIWRSTATARDLHRPIIAHIHLLMHRNVEMTHIPLSHLRKTQGETRHPRHVSGKIIPTPISPRQAALTARGARAPRRIHLRRKARARPRLAVPRRTGETCHRPTATQSKASLPIVNPHRSSSSSEIHPIRIMPIHRPHPVAHRETKVPPRVTVRPLAVTKAKASLQQSAAKAFRAICVC